MLRNKVFIAIANYSKFFILLLCINVQFCKAQSLELHANFGRLTSRFVGSGTNTATALLPNITLNNPYSSLAQPSNITSLQLAYFNKKKLGVHFGASYSAYRLYNYINKAFNATGYYKPTSGHVVSNIKQFAIDLGLTKKIKVYENLNLSISTGVQYFTKHSSKITSYTYVDFNGLQQDTLLLNTKFPVFLFDDITNNISVNATLGLEYKNIILRSSLVQGINNLYSGAFKASRNDQGNYNIYLNQFAFTIGYNCILSKLLAKQAKTSLNTP